MTDQSIDAHGDSSSNLFRTLTKDEFKTIYDFFKDIYEKSDFKKGKINVSERILEQHLGISEFTPGYINDIGIVRTSDIIEFFNKSNIYSMFFYYSYILFHKKFVEDYGSEVSLFNLPFFDGSKMFSNLIFEMPDLFVLFIPIYIHSSGKVRLHRIESQMVDFFYALWTLSKISTDPISNIKDEISQGNKHPGTYNDNVENFKVLLNENNFYTSSDFKDVFDLGMNPYEMPQNLFKYPEDTDDLTRLLFIRWHFGYSDSSNQMEILNQTLKLPEKCREILLGVFEDVSTLRYTFMLKG